MFYQVWRDIRHVTILEEIIRHKENLRFKKVSRTYGFGIFTNEDMSLLNSRVVDHSTSTEYLNRNFVSFSIVLNTNDIRTKNHQLKRHLPFGQSPCNFTHHCLPKTKTEWRQKKLQSDTWVSWLNQQITKLTICQCFFHCYPECQ